MQQSKEEVDKAMEMHFKGFVDNWSPHRRSLRRLGDIKLHQTTTTDNCT